MPQRFEVAKKQRAASRAIIEIDDATRQGVENPARGGQQFDLHSLCGLIDFELDEQTTKSQWDFGELFPAAQTRKVLSVSGTDGAGQAVAGETGRVNLGDGRGHEPAHTSFRPHLFHAQGRHVAVELRVI